MIIAEVLLFGACLFGAAGSLSWPIGWAVLGIYALPKAAALVFLDPELIRERTAPGPGVDRGDVVLATLGVLALYPATFAVAGLDAVRFGPALPMPQAVQMAALLVYALGYGFAYWAVFSNRPSCGYRRIAVTRSSRRDRMLSSGIPDTRACCSRTLPCHSHSVPSGHCCPRFWLRSYSLREHRAKIEHSGSILSVIASIRRGFVGAYCQASGSRTPAA
jgi:hypothetical protein